MNLRIAPVIRTALPIAFSVGLFLTASGQSTVGITGQTRKNLEAAYLGETTASAKYSAYAKTARAENRPGVARLFAAASQAEAIHASNHADVLKTLGQSSPKAGTFTEMIGTTAENLLDAWKGETYEKTAMYPQMIVTATREKQSGAVRTFRYALAAEKQHAALYGAARESLKAGHADTAKTSYFVCYTCGATYAKSAPAHCPVCKTGTFGRMPQ